MEQRGKVLEQEDQLRTTSEGEPVDQKFPVQFAEILHRNLPKFLVSRRVLPISQNWPVCLTSL